MTPEQKRIKIAECCGFKDISLQPFGDPDSGVGFYDWASGIPGKGGVALPDYLRDLNAMAQAEATLSGEEMAKFGGHLKPLTKPPFGTPYFRQTWWANFLRATATQRADAFLKVKGLL